MSARFCLLATRSNAALWRSVRGLFQIDSALARICFPCRDDADDFFAIWFLLTIYMRYKQHRLPHGADRMPTLFTVNHAVLAKHQIRIGEYARSGFKIDATVLLLVRP